MWFPNKKLEIAPAKFKENANVNWKDKDGNLHKAKIEVVKFKSLNVGYVYAITLEQPYNGVTSLVVKESNLSHIRKEE